MLPKNGKRKEMTVLTSDEVGRQMLVGVHCACYRQNYMDWQHGEYSEGRCESAFHALAHAGYLYRYNAESSILNLKLDPESTSRLVLDGCKHAMKYEYAEKAKTLLELVGEGSNLEEDSPLVLLIQDRDLAEAFLEESARMAHPRISAGDKRLHENLLRFGVKTLEFDKLINEDHPQIAVALSKTMEPLMRGFSVSPSRSRCWWFYLWTESQAKLAEKRSTLKVGVAVRTTVLATISRLFNSPGVMVYPSTGIAVESLPLPLAAADAETEVSSVVLWRGSIASLTFPMSDIAVKQVSSMGSTIVARLQTAIGMDSGRVSGQWYLDGDTESLVNGSEFFVIEKVSGSIAGKGRLGGEDITLASLVEGDWSILRNHTTSVSGLALLIPVKG